jgi:hypothetical protein
MVLAELGRPRQINYYLSSHGKEHDIDHGHSEKPEELGGREGITHSPSDQKGHDADQGHLEKHGMHNEL